MKKYLEITPEMQALCFAYCEGKSFLWRMFFGWRKTESKYDGQWCYFIMSKKAHKEIEDIAKSFDLEEER